MLVSLFTKYEIIVSSLLTVFILISISYPLDELDGFTNVSESEPQKISIIGSVSSYHDPNQNTGLEQTYFVFPVSNVSKTYSGIITFTSSKPVLVQSINILTLNNTLKLPIQFGTLYTSAVNNTIIIPSNLFDDPRTSGTAQFSANSIRFTANEPFLITYSFSGEQFKSTIKNDIESGLEIYRQLVGTRS